MILPDEAGSRPLFSSVPPAFGTTSTEITAQVVSAIGAETAAGAQDALRCAKPDKQREPEHAVEKCVDDKTGPDWADWISRGPAGNSFMRQFHDPQPIALARKRHYRPACRINNSKRFRPCNKRRFVPIGEDYKAICVRRCPQHPPRHTDRRHRTEQQKDQDACQPSLHQSVSALRENRAPDYVRFFTPRPRTCDACSSDRMARMRRRVVSFHSVRR